MERKTSLSHLSPILMLGVIWGLSEAALGMGLRSCASFMSGSIMTGVALFFIASSWILSRSIYGVALVVGVACLFKMFDALLLSMPLLHGAIGNPIFAFFMEGLAFLLLVLIIKKNLLNHRGGQAITGGMAALVAVNLFPLVKFATGIPACVYPGTAMPLSLYYAPLAVVLSSLTVPLGFWVGSKVENMEMNLLGTKSGKRWQYGLPVILFLVCLGFISLIRLI
ncbi:hypothetical protein KGY73_09010 [bacterium]|nr:hypothetical protein [bacterium]